MPKQLAFDGYIVKKHNDLIRSRINLTNTNSCRILAFLIAQIKTKDKKLKEEYSVDLRESLPEQAGGFSYQLIKDACRDLAEAKTELENPKKETFEFNLFFTRIKYEKGFVIAKFNADLQPFLIGLKDCFTQYNILEYIQLPSNYSQKMFELLKSWQGLPEFTMSLDELHSLLFVPKYLEKRYPDFRRTVLEKAHADIHEFTSLKYEWEAIKKGRRVDSIRFVFTAPRIKQVDTKKEKIEQSKTSKQNNKLLLECADCFQEKGNPKNCIEADSSKKCQLCKLLNTPTSEH